MRLTRTQRARFFAGEAPGITGTGPCPVAEGDVVVLSTLMSFRVTRVRRQKTGGWSLNYEVLDRRDPVRNLRRTPPRMNEGGYKEISESYRQTGMAPEPTAEAIRKAAQESAYTNFDDYCNAGGGVDEETQKRLSMEGEQGKVARKAETERRLRERPLQDQLAVAIMQAQEAGVDTRRYEAAIGQTVRALLRKTERAKAA